VVVAVQDPGIAHPAGDLLSRGGRAVDAGQDAEVVAGAGLPVRTQVPLERGLFGLGQDLAGQRGLVPARDVLADRDELTADVERLAGRGPS
jgi:hypothetical protein